MTAGRVLRPASVRQVAVAVGLTAVLCAPAAAQVPDLTGVWHGAGQQGGKQSQWSGQDLPFTPEGLARFTASKPGKGPRQSPPAYGNDPLGDANPPGLVRSLIYFRPIDTIQLPDRIVQLFEYGRFWRVIWTDGRAVPEDDGPYWYGYSVGKWEGDTLVVQSVALDGRAWLDEWGTPFSDQAKITERWRKPDATTLQLTITVDDPVLYTRPWTSNVRTLKLQPKGSPNGELLDMIFAPMDEQRFNERIRNPAGGRVN